jgi:putative addiction module component (TIGR02574 family)
MDLLTVLREVDSWPVEDRVRLVQELWDRLVDQGHEPGLTDEMKVEVDRRLAAHRANPKAAIPWEEVEAEALARLQR